MGGDEQLQASIAHVVLACVAGHGLSKMNEVDFTDVGMHANLLLHGALGFFQYQRGLINYDVTEMYHISMKASRYLPLPCLMADIHRGQLSLIFFLSGLILFTMAVTGHENTQVGDALIALSILSLGNYTIVRHKDFGCVMGEDENLQASFAHIVLCCVAGRGISRMARHSYTDPGMHTNLFIHGVLGFFHYQSKLLDNDFGAAYKLSLKATRYLALPCLMADLYRSDHGLSIIHLVSGLVPFTLAMTGKDNPQLGDLVVACNIVSLCCYTIHHHREWGWYTAAGGLVAYFLSAQLGPSHKVMYPLSLALMEYCAYRLFCVHYSSSSPTQ